MKLQSCYPVFPAAPAMLPFAKQKKTHCLVKTRRTKKLDAVSRPSSLRAISFAQDFLSFRARTAPPQELII